MTSRPPSHPHLPEYHCNIQLGRCSIAARCSPSCSPTCSMCYLGRSIKSCWRLVVVQQPSWTCWTLALQPAASGSLPAASHYRCSSSRLAMISAKPHWWIITISVSRINIMPKKNLRLRVKSYQRMPSINECYVMRPGYGKFQSIKNTSQRSGPSKNLQLGTIFMQWIVTVFEI